MPKILALLDAGSIILTVVERTMATGKTVTHQAMAAIVEIKDRVDAMILNSCCITTCELWAAIGIGKLALMAIIREVGNKKICVKLVLKIITIEHKPAQRNIRTERPLCNKKDRYLFC
jgi:hypothetical protein